jgi:hypothetical protein
MACSRTDLLSVSQERVVFVSGEGEAALRLQQGNQRRVAFFAGAIDRT